MRSAAGEVWAVFALLTSEFDEPVLNLEKRSTEVGSAVSVVLDPYTHENPPIAKSTVYCILLKSKLKFCSEYANTGNVIRMLINFSATPKSSTTLTWDLGLFVPHIWSTVADGQLNEICLICCGSIHCNPLWHQIWPYIFN